MALFSNLKSDGLEETQDRLGGGFQAKDTDVYEATIKVMYAGQSAGGAHSVTMLADIDGTEYRETIYITNKKGENFFLNKQDPTKKVPLPGFTTVDHICQIAGGAPLCDQPASEKMVNIYDYDLKKEVPKSVMVLTDLIDQKIALGIVKQTVDINEKNGNGDYVPTGKTRDENVIDKVFDIDTKLTVVEAVNGLTEGVFQASWLEKNKGVTRNKTGKTGANDNGKGGRPAGAPPQAGAATKTKSLFGNKG